MHSPYSWQVLLFSFPDVTNHPLFTISFKLSMYLLGDNEIAFRLPVYLSGVFSVLLIYNLTLTLFECRKTAFLSGFLLFLSFPHFHYSQEGRGYSLSLFFSIMVLHYSFQAHRTKILANQLLLVFSGFFLVFALPSNFYFLIGLVAFWTWFLMINSRVPFDMKVIFKYLKWHLLTLAIATIYLLIIYSDLKKGILSYQNYAKMFLGIESLAFSGERFFAILMFLADPWGLWFFIIFLCGFISLLRKKEIFVLTFCSIGIPLILTYFNRLMGPPRAYIYVLPLFLILCGSGISWLTNLFPIRFRNRIFVLALITVSIQPIMRFSNFYLDPLEGKDTLIREAKSAELFVRENLGENDLLIIPYSDIVLRRYLEPLIAEKMLRITKTKKIRNIFVLGNKNNSVHQIIRGGGYPTPTTSIFKEKDFELRETFDRLNFFKANLKTSLFIPQSPILDYEKYLGLKDTMDNALLVSQINEPKLVGDSALLIKKKIRKNVNLFSPKIKQVEIKSNNAYFLMIYARKYSQYGGSLANLSSPNVAFSPTLFINPYFAVFEAKNVNLSRKQIHPYSNVLVKANRFSTDSKAFQWQIIFAVSPIKSGKRIMVELFRLKQELNYFDEMQSFILWN